MFNDEDQEYKFLPKLSVGIPVTGNVAAVLTHMVQQGLGNFYISLDDLSKDGATLVISSRILLYPAWKDENYGSADGDAVEGDEANADVEAEEEEEDRMKHLKRFMADYKREKAQEKRINKWSSPGDLRRLQEEDGIAKYDEDEDDSLNSDSEYDI